MLIGEKMVVRIDYTLKNATGEVLDTSDGGEPLTYIHGAHQIVPGLERELAGLRVGDSKDVVVAPEDGYGQPDPQGIFGVPRAAFPAGVELQVGESFLGEDDMGGQVPVRVVEVREDTIVVDANHPLAGETLYFHVDVRDVREATLDELMHGHVHGPGGHEHEHD
jgi:FKBP-type peptidyl-prolyl cis-trans isomerase SlyD